MFSSGRLAFNTVLNAEVGLTACFHFVFGFIFVCLSFWGLSRLLLRKRKCKWLESFMAREWAELHWEKKSSISCLRPVNANQQKKKTKQNKTNRA